MSGKLIEMREKFPNTHVWVDSCSKADLEYGMSVGCVGATTNPVIVNQVLGSEMPEWKDTITELYKSNPEATEDDVAWMLIEKMGLRGCEMLRPVYEKENGACGKISMQTNIKNYHNAEKMAAQAVGFSKLADNIMVKMPINEAGLKAFEEATYRGVSINATVSFSVAQAVALAEAVERGMKRREAEGKDTSKMTPVCTIMIGRIDDWLKKAVARDSVAIDPEALEWAGVAVFKKAYKIFKERGYRTRLLTAAYRNIHHWQQFIGGDVSMTITSKWLKVYDNSNVEIRNYMDDPVPQQWLDQLDKLPDFHRAYDEDGMTVAEFEYYGAFVTCLEGFFKGYEQLLQQVRPMQFGSVLK
ncbi:MAG: transaldolase family protein [Clostridia bacterium]|nr:transaldolase family protein [Clostridia bacterium]